MSVTIFSPAKINLFLAVTARRSDGFHDLVSVAAPLDFGDDLTASVVERRNGQRFYLNCDDPAIPRDASNLILKAALAFADATGWPDPAGRQAVQFRLTKRIPMGAGLGGGSSNAVAALRAMNALSGNRVPLEELSALAAGIGSDCALFLHDAPVVIRGRGERVESLPAAAVGRLRGRKVLLFKPSFGISTPWAYRKMAAEAPTHYLPESQAERRLSDWISGGDSFAGLLFNNMEGVAFRKFVALPVMLGKLKAELGVKARLSGSGSTCFALADEAGSVSPRGAPTGAEDGKPDLVTQMKHLIRQGWGEAAFIQEASLA
jgi:4-diphosphocytidyl-2-C-methyl-D-erythritol kinase